MRFNTLKPAIGAKKEKTRVGRGMGSGLGKTCGRGHKGQRARAGGYHKVGFEGGQMPLQRRLPKFGFNSPTVGCTEEVRLHELAKIVGDRADLTTLKAAGIIRHSTEKAKVIASGKIDKAIILIGIKATVGARLAIETAGGRVEV